MNSRQLKEKIQEALTGRPYRFSYNQKEDKLRIEHEKTHKGLSISLPGILNKYEEGKDMAIEEVIYYIEEMMTAMDQSHQIKGHESRLFPVIRSTSFPTETNGGKKLIYKEHTAETRIFYALDLDQSYRLIDQDLMNQEGYTHTSLDEIARFNLKSLPVNTKKDSVAGNDYYFINYNDGYDASRILNQSLLEEMEGKAEGELTVAVPHQDVLIFGDIKNQRGYDILAQMTMHFFTNGLTPITALPFLYEDRKLEPIFILAKNKPIDEENEKGSK